MITTIGFKPCSKALRNTYLVCGIGPSKESTNNNTPSTMFNTRSTSPPKSAWPGVSTMLIFTSLCITAVFLERIVIPLSRSRSLESITRSATFSLSRKIWLCLSNASTNVVLPWSTWAIIATLRRFSRIILYSFIYLSRVFLIFVQIVLRQSIIYFILGFYKEKTSHTFIL